jgi:transposase
VSGQRRKELVDQFEQSKLSGQKFAKLTGLKYSTFAAWVSKRRKERDAISPALPGHGKSASVEWLETVITEAQNAAPVAGSALVVRLPSGAAIEVANAAQAGVAAALLRAWEKAPC